MSKNPAGATDLPVILVSYLYGPICHVWGNCGGCASASGAGRFAEFCRSGTWKRAGMIVLSPAPFATEAIRLRNS